MNIHDLYEQRSHFYLQSSAMSRGGIYFCILVGILTFGLGMYLGEQTRTWGSFLFNLFFFFSVALGGIAFAGMQDVVGAVWGRPIMRIHEAFAAFLVPAAALFLIFFACLKAGVLGADKVYKWIANPEMLEHFWGKKTWLQENFMVWRDIAAIVIILLLALWQLKIKVGRDLILVRGDKDQALRQGLLARDKLRFWSAPVLVVYALCFSLLCFDMTMSLAPTWFSTLWGGWHFAVMMQTLMALLLVFMFALKSTSLGAYIKRQQFHDVGKLMHGFTIFFAYLTYAHVLTYWYGNVPEETEYFIHRMHGPWLGIVIVAPILAFVIPLFALLPKASKWTAGLTLPISGMILFAQWMVYLLVVQPEVTDGARFNGWIEVGGFLGMLGLFLACFYWFGKRYPMLGLADPLLPEALAGDHP